MQRATRVLGGLSLLFVVACGGGASAPELPRPPEGGDPLVRASAERLIAACERGEPGALVELAMLYDASQLDELALVAYDRALAAPGAAGELHHHRGRVLADLERPEEAEQAFRRATELDPSYAPTFWRRAQLLLELGRLDEARADLERALALEPASIQARLALARLELLLDRPEAALDALAPLVERQPEERFVHDLVARAKLALGDEAGAAAARELEARATRVTQGDPRTAAVKQRAVAIVPRLRAASDALAADRPKEALKQLEPLFADAPEDLAVLQTFARALVQAGESARALEVLETARSLHPDDFKLELYTALALQARGDAQGALARLARARTLNEAYGPTHVAEGELLARLGRAAEAEQAFARALACPEVVLRTHLSLGEVQREQAAWERAAATYRRAHEEFPDSAAPLAFLAEVEWRLGRAAEARATLAEAERRNAAHPQIAVVRALFEEGSR